MLRKLLIFATLTLLAEIVLLFKLNTEIGILKTLGVIICTALAGVLAARVQGWLVWQKIQLDLSRGVLPADGLIEAIVLFAAGLMLVTPGLITDAMGLVLLLPAARRIVREWGKRKFREMIERSQTEVLFSHRGPVINVRPIDDENRRDEEQ